MTVFKYINHQLKIQDLVKASSLKETNTKA